MKKYELTPEHESKFPEIREKWITNAFRTDSIRGSEEELKIKARALYAAAGLVAPERVVFVDNPIAGAFVTGAACAYWSTVNNIETPATRDATRDATWAATWNATWNATWAATRDATLAATWNATWAATRDATRDATREATEEATWKATLEATLEATRDATREATWNATWNATRERDLSKWYVLNFKLSLPKFSLECSKTASNLIQYGNQWSYLASYHDFFKNVAKIEIDYSKWDALNDMIVSSGPYFLHKNFIVICDRPEVLKLDERNRPHCENGPYCRWRDGTALYMWHGVKVPAWYIEEKEKLTPAYALNISNVEERRVACEILGWDKVLEDPSLNPKVIDEDLPHIGKLIEVDLPGAPKQWFIKYQCGTGRWFAESVNDKSFNTALKANAGGNGWRGQGDPESFIPFIRT